MPGTLIGQLNYGQENMSTLYQTRNRKYAEETEEEEEALNSHYFAFSLAVSWNSNFHSALSVLEEVFQSCY